MHHPLWPKLLNIMQWSMQKLWFPTYFKLNYCNDLIPHSQHCILVSHQNITVPYKMCTNGSNFLCYSVQSTLCGMILTVSGVPGSTASQMLVSATPPLQLQSTYRRVRIIFKNIYFKNWGPLKMILSMKKKFKKHKN